MKDIRLNVLVEQPVSYGVNDGGPVPLNQIAERGAYATTRWEDETTVREAWKIPAGAEISLPDAAADTLIGLGYAELIG